MKPATILVVDDDECVRRFTLRALRSQGFHTLEAFDGNSGLASFIHNRNTVDLVLSDIMMSGCSGPVMVEKILRLEPCVRIAFASGTVGVESLPEHLRHVPVLEKPFDSKGLTKFVNNCLETVYMVNR